MVDADTARSGGSTAVLSFLELPKDAAVCASVWRLLAVLYFVSTVMFDHCCPCLRNDSVCSHIPESMRADQVQTEFILECDAVSISHLLLRLRKVQHLSGTRRWQSLLAVSPQNLMNLGEQGRDLTQQVAQRPILRLHAVVLLCRAVLLRQQMRSRRSIERPPRRPSRSRQRPLGCCATGADLQIQVVAVASRCAAPMAVLCPSRPQGLLASCERCCCVQTTNQHVQQMQSEAVRTPWSA